MERAKYYNNWLKYMVRSIFELREVIGVPSTSEVSGRLHIPTDRSSEWVSWFI